MASSNSVSSSHPSRSTASRRSMAMWVGGPPKPVQPMRPHSRAIVARETSGRCAGDRRRRAATRRACLMLTAGPRTRRAPPAQIKDRRQLLERRDVRIGAVEPGVHRVDGEVGGAGLAPAPRVLGQLVVVAGARTRGVPRSRKCDRSRPASAAPSWMISSASSSPPPRAHHGEPAVGRPAHPAQGRRREGADPDRDRPLHRQGRQPRRLDVVELPLEGDAPLRPQRPQHGHLLLQDGAPGARRACPARRTRPCSSRCRARGGSGRRRAGRARPPAWPATPSGAAAR